MTTPFDLPPDRAKTPVDLRQNEVARDAQAIIDAFYAAVLACGRTPPLKPTVEIARSPGATRYDAHRRLIVLIPYEILPDAYRAAMDRFAAIGLLGLDGRGQYSEIFNSLLVPHELGHWLQEITQRPLDRWQAEYNANQFMVAFWREHPAPAPAHATERRLANFTVQPPSMQDPIPAGSKMSPSAYFNSHYAEIARNPMAYAAFQKMMVRQAMGETPVPSFAQLVDEAWG